MTLREWAACLLAFGAFAAVCLWAAEDCRARGGTPMGRVVPNQCAMP